MRNKNKGVKVAMTGWKVATRPTISCSQVKEPDVYLERVVIDKIGLLMDAYPHQEWLGYLAGIQEEDNFLVEDLIIPPHASANGGSAEAEPFNIPVNCIGLIHSHHTMGAFHSGTDQAHVDRNYPISITVAKKSGGQLEYDTISCRRTECGKEATVKGHIKYVQPRPEFNTEEWLAGAKTNIDKGVRVYQYQAPVTHVKYANGQEYIDRQGELIPVNHRIYDSNGLNVVGIEDDDGKEILTGKDGKTMTKQELTKVTDSIWNKG
jgi:hypothetical protein